MTSPGDPLSTLGDAVNRHVTAQETMKAVGATLRRAREEGIPLDQAIDELEFPGAVPTDR
jgi:hypothetical protein